MKLNEIADNAGARKARMRVAAASARGRARPPVVASRAKLAHGVAIKGFEGGQMPLTAASPSAAPAADRSLAGRQPRHAAEGDRREQARCRQADRRCRHAGGRPVQEGIRWRSPPWQRRDQDQDRSGRSRAPRRRRSPRSRRPAARSSCRPRAQAEAGLNPSRVRSSMASAAEQLASNLNWGAIGKATELKKRLWFTVGALVVFRIGAYVPVPGVDPHALAEIFQQERRRHRRHARRVLGRLDRPHVGAGALEIMPYSRPPSSCRS